MSGSDLFTEYDKDKMSRQVNWVSKLNLILFRMHGTELKQIKCGRSLVGVRTLSIGKKQLKLRLKIIQYKHC